MPLFTRSLIALLVVAGTTLAQGVRFRDEIFTQCDVVSDIAYGSALNPSTNLVETLELDHYTPTGDTSTDRPAVVFVHGGGFVGGDKATGTSVALCESFAKRGYVAVSINYRLTSASAAGQVTPQEVVEDAKEDFKAAVRYVRSVAGAWGVDPNRIAAIGSSAGAITVLTGTYVPGEGQSGNPGFSSEVQVVAGLWGAMEDPLEIDAGEAPVFLLHGTADPIVPFSASVAIQQQAQAVGVPVEFIPAVGAGHGVWGDFFGIYIEDLAAFSWEHLALGQRAGLSVQPGYAAPGTAVLEATGLANDLRFLVAGVPAANPTNYPGIGDLLIASSTALVWELLPIPAAPRIATATTNVLVPASVQGALIRIQEYHTDSTGIGRVLTNAVDLTF